MTGIMNSQIKVKAYISYAILLITGDMQHILLHFNNKFIFKEQLEFENDSLLKTALLLCMKIIINKIKTSNKKSVR